MAEIDKAIGLGKTIEKRRKRSISENQNQDTNDIENPSINKPIKTKLRERKFYDGQYALLNELPTVWNFFKELWNRPKSSNTIDKQPIKKEINLSEIKPTKVQTKPIAKILQITQEIVPTEVQTD